MAGTLNGMVNAGDDTRNPCERRGEIIAGLGGRHWESTGLAVAGDFGLRI